MSAVRIPEVVYAQVRLIAMFQGRSMGEVLAEALRESLGGE